MYYEAGQVNVDFNRSATSQSHTGTVFMISIKVVLAKADKSIC